MPDEQRNPGTPDPAKNATDATVLDLLVEDENQRPWTWHELTLEIGSAAVVEDAINNLQAAGLVHKTSDGFIFATRAAVTFEQIRRYWALTTPPVFNWHSCDAAESRPGTHADTVR